MIDEEMAKELKEQDVRPNKLCFDYQEKEQKEKYANFLDKVSEILGLNRPVDILRLCAVTDKYLKPIEKRIAELEKENAELKGQVEMSYEVYNDNLDYSYHIEGQLTKAKEIIEKLLDNLTAIDGEQIRELKVVREAEQFLKELEKAFNAGKTKWHKVAHGDLPSEEGGWVCNQNGLPCFFDWGTEQWLDCEGTQIRTTEWCHMPHKE